MSFFSIAFTIPYLSDMWEKAVYVVISSYALTLFGSFFSIAFFLVSVANFFGWVKKSVLEDFPFWILLRTLGFDFFIDKPKWLVVMLLHVPCFNLLLRSHQRNVIVSTHFRLVRIQSCNLDDQFTARLVFTQYFDTLHIFRLINKISNQRIRRKNLNLKCHLQRLDEADQMGENVHVKWWMHLEPNQKMMTIMKIDDE